MSAPQFTPGNWTIEDRDAKYPMVVCGEEVIAGAVRTEADAHLISASKDLYAALEKVLEAYLYEARQGDGVMEEFAPRVDAARAALAKARGESP